jgi:hypothetical protein
MCELAIGAPPERCYLPDKRESKSFGSGKREIAQQLAGKNYPRNALRFPFVILKMNCLKKGEAAGCTSEHSGPVQREEWTAGFAKR